MAYASISGWSGAGSRAFTLTVEEQSSNASTNTSVVKWTLTVSGESYWYDSYVKCTVNGSVVYNKTVSWNGGFPAQTGSTSGTLTVTHDQGGGKTISFAIEGYAYQYSTKYGSGTLTLSNLDRTTPNVSTTVGTITKNSIYITVTASANCNKWEYRLNNGSWVSFSNQSGTTQSKTIEGLSMNTSYVIDTRATKTSNSMLGYADAVTAKTIGSASISSANPITLGSACSVAWTALDTSHKFKLTFTVGSTSRTTGFISATPSTNINPYTGYTPSISDFASEITNSKTGSMTIRLTTYLESDDSSVIGYDETTVTVTVPQSTAPNAPTVSVSQGSVSSGFTKSSGGALCVKGLSSLSITTQASGKNSARITGYTVTVDNKTYNKTTNSQSINDSLETNIINTSGTITVSVTVSDSRGYTSAAGTATIYVADYSPPSGSVTSVLREVTGVTGMSVLTTVAWDIAPVLDAETGGKPVNTGNVTVVRKKVYSGATASKVIKSISASTSGSTTPLSDYSGTGTWTAEQQAITDAAMETYEYTLTITDRRGSDYAVVYTTSTGVICMSRLGGGKGVTFFGEAQEEGLWLVEEGVYKNVTYGNANTFYGTCSTAASSTPKIVDCAKFTAANLEEGTTILVKFSDSNAVSSPTLNVNGTGAKAIRRYGSTSAGTTSKTSWRGGAVCMLVYDGTNWVINSGFDDDTTYPTMTQSEATTGTGTRASLITPKVLSDTITNKYNSIATYTTATGTMTTAVWASPTSTTTWTAPSDGVYLITMFIGTVSDDADSHIYKQFRWTGTATNLLGEVCGLYFRGDSVSGYGINSYTWSFPVLCTTGDTVSSFMWTSKATTYNVRIVGVRLGG